ncbi:hypothetical protein U9M48_000259, partial [Paspalum notatum var. saurae]
LISNSGSMVDAGIVVAICQYGGEFTTSGPDGNLIYNGGKAHVVAITRDLSLESFKNELSKVFHVDVADMSLKYFLPNNNKTLITISCDLHLQRMVDFTSNAAQVHVFLISRQENRGFQMEFGNDITFTTTAGSASFTPEILDQQNLALDDDNIPMEAFSDGADNPYVGSEIMEVSPQELNPTVLWDDNDIIKGVGQEFDNVKDFHAQLCKYAMGKGFAYRFIKNETTRVSAKCDAEGGCTWRLHASESSRNKKFVIKKMTVEHTCGGGGGKGPHRGTRQWLITTIKEMLDDNPLLKPKDLVKELYEEYGVTPSYGQVWRGKEVAEKELYHAMREAHNHLPWYCQRLEETNPGSITVLSPLLGTTKFRRFFVAFHACLHGFVNGCRPLIFLDKVPLKATNEYKLLVAAAVDADDVVFPVAFNVVEDENHDTWVWFLTQLKLALQTHNYPYYHAAMTFLSSGHKDLDAAVSLVFEGSQHAFCFHHIREEFKGELRKGPWSQELRERMVEDLTRAAQACSIEDLSSSIESIRSISSDAAGWVIARKPEHWSDSIFRGCRYGHSSLNIIADALDNWIPAKKESSMVLMIDSLRIKIKEAIESRREACRAWAGPLTPTAEDKVQAEVLNACNMDVVRSSETVFEVRGDAVLVVDLASLECTCRRWQLSGLPCRHAVAVFNRLGQCLYDYCSKCFGIESYQMIYSGTIHAVPELDIVDFTAGIPRLPPPKQQRASSGRPRRRRRRSNPNKISTIIRLCSRCKQAGHNKATCEAPQL